MGASFQRVEKVSSPLFFNTRKNLFGFPKRFLFEELCN